MGRDVDSAFFLSLVADMAWDPVPWSLLPGGVLVCSCGQHLPFPIIKGDAVVLAETRITGPRLVNPTGPLEFTWPLSVPKG